MFKFLFLVITWLRLEADLVCGSELQWNSTTSEPSVNLTEWSAKLSDHSRLTRHADELCVDQSTMWRQSNSTLPVASNCRTVIYKKTTPEHSLHEANSHTEHTRVVSPTLTFNHANRIISPQSLNVKTSPNGEITVINGKSVTPILYEQERTPTFPLFEHLTAPDNSAKTFTEQTHVGAPNTNHVTIDANLPEEVNVDNKQNGKDDKKSHRDKTKSVKVLARDKHKNNPANGERKKSSKEQEPSDMLNDSIDKQVESTSTTTTTTTTRKPSRTAFHRDYSSKQAKFGSKISSISQKTKEDKHKKEKPKLAEDEPNESSSSTQSPSSTSTTTKKSILAQSDKKLSNRIEFLRTRYKNPRNSSKSSVSDTKTSTTTSQPPIQFTTTEPLSVYELSKNDPEPTINTESTVQIKPTSIPKHAKKTEMGAKWRGYHRATTVDSKVASTTTTTTTVRSTTTDSKTSNTEASYDVIPGTEISKQQIPEPVGIRYQLEPSVPSTTASSISAQYSKEHSTNEDDFGHFKFLFPSRDNFGPDINNIETMGFSDAKPKQEPNSQLKQSFMDLSVNSFGKHLHKPSIDYSRIVGLRPVNDQADQTATTTMPEVLVTIENRYIFVRNGTTLHQPIPIDGDNKPATYSQSQLSMPVQPYKWTKMFQPEEESPNKFNSYRVHNSQPNHHQHDESPKLNQRPHPSKTSYYYKPNKPKTPSYNAVPQDDSFKMQDMSYKSQKSNYEKLISQFDDEFFKDDNDYAQMHNKYNLYAKQINEYSSPDMNDYRLMGSNSNRPQEERPSLYPQQSDQSNSYPESYRQYHSLPNMDSPLGTNYDNQEETQQHQNQIQHKYVQYTKTNDLNIPYPKELTNSVNYAESSPFREKLLFTSLSPPSLNTDVEIPVTHGKFSHMKSYRIPSNPSSENLRMEMFQSKSKLSEHMYNDDNGNNYKSSMMLESNSDSNQRLPSAHSYPFGMPRQALEKLAKQSMGSVPVRANFAKTRPVVDGQLLFADEMDHPQMIPLSSNLYKARQTYLLPRHMLRNSQERPRFVVRDNLFNDNSILSDVSESHPGEVILKVSTPDPFEDFYSDRIVPLNAMVDYPLYWAAQSNKPTIFTGDNKTTISQELSKQAKKSKTKLYEIFSLLNGTSSKKANEKSIFDLSSMAKSSSPAEPTRLMKVHKLKPIAISHKIGFGNNKAQKLDFSESKLSESWANSKSSNFGFPAKSALFTYQNPLENKDKRNQRVLRNLKIIFKTLNRVYGLNRLS